MLRIKTSTVEYYDEKLEMFINPEPIIIELEHSLNAISKWESKWNKPFITTKEKTTEETIDYIKCMTITQNVSHEVYNNLTNENIKEIGNYIAAPMTATTFIDTNGKKSREIITSELLYYKMITYNIPFECQKWHLNRLITLLRVCDNKNTPPKKMSRAEIMKRNYELNEQRKKQHNTNG